MINKVEIKFPEFGLDLEREFGPGINLIEEPNGYGKTTILNTILSLWSKKYPGLRTLPPGTAKIFADDKVYMLSKKIWIGLDQEPNDLIKYILPGEFFNLDTPKQREILVRLLGIDFNSYMKDYVPEWHKDLEKDLKARLSENVGKESIILEDITRLKSIIIKFEKNPIVITDNSREIENTYAMAYRKDAEYRLKIQSDNNSLVAHNNRIESQIASLVEKQQVLRKKFMDLNGGTCPTCGQKQTMTAEQKKAINDEGLALAAQIKELQGKIKNDLPKTVPEAWPDRTLEEKAKFLKLTLQVSSQEDIDKVREYDAAKSELAIKEKQLKSLGELDDKNTLATIKSTKIQFTKELEEKVKTFGLEIELFKELASGELTESFQIMHDGKSYNELSGGNRLLVQIRMAMVFVRQLGLDFILIDEAGLISQKNFELIEQECKDVQVIMARATPFQFSKVEAKTKTTRKKAS